MTPTVRDESLIDLFDIGVKVYFNDRPITRMTPTLSGAIQEFCPNGPDSERTAAVTALLAFIVKDARDSMDLAPEGEPCWVTHIAEHHPWTWRLWDELPEEERADVMTIARREAVWIVPNGTTEYADVPGSDGGWTAMFASDQRED